MLLFVSDFINLTAINAKVTKLALRQSQGVFPDLNPLCIFSDIIIIINAITKILQHPGHCIWWSTNLYAMCSYTADQFDPINPYFQAKYLSIASLLGVDRKNLYATRYQVMKLPLLQPLCSDHQTEGPAALASAFLPPLFCSQYQIFF